MTSAENLINRQAPAQELFEQAGQAAAASLQDPIADVHGSADYRRQLVAVLVARCLAEAVERAG